MIFILDNVLTKEECSNLIRIYNSNKDFSHTHGDPVFYPLNINRILTDKEITSNLVKKIEETTNKYFTNNVIDWCEIVKWPSNSWQPFHLDTASTKTTLTSITYLNEEFSGGSTLMLDGTKIKPKTGRTVIFDGNAYIHGVEPVLFNDRYTVPIWYKNTVGELT